MVLIIVSFVLGLAMGVLLARYFFPELRVKYKIVEREVQTIGEENTEKEKSNLPRRYAKREK